MVKYGYILYACPTGQLADVIDSYFEKTKETLGPNTAHSYMPHCTLTGFFKDASEAAPTYIAALEEAISASEETKPERPVSITELLLSEKFHGLKLEGAWLEAVAATFKQKGDSPSRNEEIRLKDWLHLSLAYNFPPEQHAPLSAIAHEMIDISLPVGWEIRLYERLINQDWVLHYRNEIV